MALSRYTVCPLDVDTFGKARDPVGCHFVALVLAVETVAADVAAAGAAAVAFGSSYLRYLAL